MPEAPTTPKLPSARRSRLFYPRIAVSVFFGVLTVLLVVLWVRSHHYADTLCRPNNVLISSEQGELSISWSDQRTQVQQLIYTRPVVRWNPSNKSFLPNSRHCLGGITADTAFQLIFRTGPSRWLRLD